MPDPLMGVTTNGVRIRCTHNVLIGTGDVPLLEFERDGDGYKLVAVNIDGYVIEKVLRGGR